MNNCVLVSALASCWLILVFGLVIIWAKKDQIEQLKVLGLLEARFRKGSKQH